MNPILGFGFYVTNLKRDEYGVCFIEVCTNYLYVLKKLLSLRQGQFWYFVKIFIPHFKES
jgi:hypothetical protein